jgi:hypothetical protein
MVSRRAEEPLVVGIAAHHSVKDNDIGRLDASWIDRDVVTTPLRPSL